MTDNQFLLLINAIFGLLVIINYMRAENLSAKVDEQADKITELEIKIEHQREAKLSWERKYRRLLGAKVTGVIRVKVPQKDEEFSRN